MKKNNAWTMVELVAAVTIIIMLSAICLSTMKPNHNKSKLFFYTTVLNLERAQDAMRAHCGDYQHIISADGECGSIDNYPSQMMDSFATKDSSTLANGVTLSFPGVWNQSASQPYKSRNIVIDINGGKGPNKDKIDQLTVRTHLGGKADGLIVPLNGSSISTDTDAISFDIYRAESKNAKTAFAVATNLSYPEAFCRSQGKYYTVLSDVNCSSYTPYDACLTKSGLCKDCIVNDNDSGCPYGSSPSCKGIAEGSNPDDQPCFVMLHQPGVGMGFFAQSIAGQLLQ